MALSSEARIVLTRVKIEWAKHNLRNLEAMLIDFRNQRMTVIDTKVDTHSAQERQEYASYPIRPFGLSTAAGDVIHNLRSALDHLANQLVWAARGQEPTRRVEFPIAKDFATYERDKVAKVEGMSTAAKEAIDRLKPYKGGNDTLWRIHELDNLDKHRALFTVDRDTLFMSDWYRDDISDAPYLHRTSSPHFSGVWDEYVKNDINADIDEAFGEAQVAQSDALLPSLHQLIQFVEHLVLSFKPLLGG